MIAHLFGFLNGFLRFSLSRCSSGENAKCAEKKKREISALSVCPAVYALGNPTMLAALIIVRKAKIS